MARVSLSQQIEEVQRELDQRGSVYPRLIAKLKLRQSIADFHMRRLTQVLRTLVWLQRHEAVIRERCPDLFGEDA